jgi:cellulose synthase/poly-beta-1,6-N-acetylglucosamine synthase-like glycosyltransferase
MIAALYAIAIAVLTVYGGNLLWLAVQHAWHERLRPGPVPDPDDLPTPDASWPVVTVQLPLYNEADVAARLIDACAQLTYPRSRMEIQVLDDSTDETTDVVEERVQHWARHGVDIVHIHRTDRTGYKAGALQNGLRLARGDLIALFDADFLPPADFLQRMVPQFDAPDVGMVQARWGHLNAEASLLTRLQAFGLDAHFAVEQAARQDADCFINFNGTAGVWRRTCIEDAGGWEADTLTEDLDLSYRAQLLGWRFHFCPAVEAPAELPVSMNAFRTQQFRWTKGAVETTRKLLRPLWTSSEPIRVKLEGTLHLTAHFAFPFILLAALTHAPLLWLKHTGAGPGDAYFALMSLGLIGFAGFFLAQGYAQRALYADWPRRLRRFPLFMAGSIGLALSNTRALWQGLRGTASSFVRTPKTGTTHWWMSRYTSATVSAIAWGEVLLALYSIAGLGVVLVLGEWAAVPFQAFFAAGLSLVAGFSLQQAIQARRITSPA